MKKTKIGGFLLAALVAILTPELSSCAVDNSNGPDYTIHYDGTASATFNGKWLFDGQNLGYGKVTIDSLLTFNNLPLADIIGNLLPDYIGSLSTLPVYTTAERQQVRIEYVGVSQTSDYFNLPASELTFTMTVGDMPCDVRLLTAATGSVALLQESKNRLSVVMKIAQAQVVQQSNGMLLADTRKEHTLMFESDINN